MKKDVTEFIPTKEEEQEYLAYKTEQDFIDNLENGIKELDRMEIARDNRKIVLISGAMVAFDKGTIQYLNQIADQDRETRYILLSEVTAENRRKTRECIKFEYLCTPHLLAKEMFVSYFPITISEEVKEYISERGYLCRAIENLHGRHRNAGEGYIEAWICYADRYIQHLLDKVHPQRVVLWNEFYAFHMIFDHICAAKKIPVMYMEFGCIPGTLSLELLGQQGESYIARHPWRFRTLPVRREEIRFAETVKQYIVERRLNRNKQPEYGRLNIKKEEIGKPIIVYFGQNDYESGLAPYTEKSRKYHSPFLKSTQEGFEILQNLAEKNNWILIYKPHPIMQNLGMDEDVSFQDIRMNDINIHELIDCADVVVTILSQSAYEAIMRDKPVVMLGYTELHKSGIIYEAYSQQKVEKILKQAIKKGYTKRQRKRFIRHIARLLKYCLLDDQTHPEFPYGKGIAGGTQ